MQTVGKSIVVCSIIGVLLVAGGCGSDTQRGSGSGAAGEAEGPDGASPGPANAAGVTAAGKTPEEVNPAVVINTSLGNITVDLDDEKAPLTVENFLAYVERGFYDQTIFHQVFPGAVILGGMFTPNLTEKNAGPPVPNEAHNGLKNTRGTMAMARQYDVINSATCQFFINVKDNPNYDHKPEALRTLEHPEDYGYCVFGRVTSESMDVIDRIANVQVEDTPEFERLPAQTVMINSIRRIR